MSDVYAYGMISPSRVLMLRDDFAFPAANGYGEISRTLNSVGGEAANSAIVLAKFGVSTKLDGNWINSRNQRHVLDLLSPFGIDLSRLTIRADGGTEEIVITGHDSRAVFGNYAAFHDGPKQWNDPNSEDIAHSRVVCLDPFLRQESTRCAEFCVRHAKPYVTLDCGHDDFMAQNAAAVVISHELRDRVYPGSDLKELFARYLDRCRGLVIFTFGGDPLWYGRRGNKLQSFRPYKIKPLDTVGAGDAFRGAIAYGILKEWSDAQTIEFASAVSACVCLTTPHALNAPGLDGIAAFQKAHPRAG